MDIPVPDIRWVEHYERDVPNNYHIPLSYVRYHKRTVQEWNQTLEYVGDFEDELWLRKYNATKFAVAPRETKRLALHLLEQMMDILETATAFDAIITTNQADQLFQVKIPELYATFALHSTSKNGTNMQQQSSQPVVTTKTIIQDVYTYWVQKRSKLKRPLLRRFWPVTSSDDTNPHLVFRPREKEKYKLRKKRQNDANAYRKLKQLRDEFDTLRCVLQLVRRREELAAQRVRLVVDQFDQRLYECVDTTGTPRESMLETVDTTVPLLFDTRSRPPKRIRTDMIAQRGDRAGVGSSTVGTSNNEHVAVSTDNSNNSTSTIGFKTQIAGRNNGEPAPHFLHPLPSRETWAVSYQGTTPHMATYQGNSSDGDSSSRPFTTRFRHRPRVGRGGRLCIDRVPLPEPDDPSLRPPTVYTAGRPLPYATASATNKPRQRLLDLLPTPLDHAAVARRIETMSVAAIKEDYDAAATAQADGSNENDGEVVVVPLQDWLETDDHTWGEERYSIGPV